MREVSVTITDEEEGESVPIGEGNMILDPQVEREFSVIIQRKRKQLADSILSKRPLEYVLVPAEKQHRGP